MKLSKFCISMAMVMAAGSFVASAYAADAKVLKGGGSNIMYVITPSHSNPFFKTEAEVASATAKELGYEVKMVSHDDSPVKQSELFETAISLIVPSSLLRNSKSVFSTFHSSVCSQSNLA